MKQVESDHELPPLSEASDAELARAVSSLRAHRPDITELASLASQLAVRGIAVTPPEVPPSPTTAVWKKWAFAGGGAASGVVLWWALREPLPAPPLVPRESANELSLPAAREPAAPPALAPRRGGAAPERAAAVSAGDLATSDVAPTAPPAVDVAPASPAAPAPTDAPLVPARAGTAVKEREPSGAQPGARSPANAATTQPFSRETTSAFSTPTEIELLRDARLALKSSPGRALELAESHGRSYPGGKLTQERELIAISALVSLGRRTAALSRASRFEQAFPTSPYRKQIGELLR